MKKSDKNILIFITMLSITACGESNAENSSTGEKAIMMEKIDDPVLGMGFTDAQKEMMRATGRLGKAIQYKHCIQSQSASLKDEYNGRKAEIAEDGKDSETTVISLIDKCPQPANAQCVHNSGKRTDFYYSNSSRVLKSLQEKCEPQIDNSSKIPEGLSEMAKKFGGKWTSFITTSDVETKEKSKLSDSEQAKQHMQAVDTTMAKAFFGNRMKDKASILKLLEEEPGAIQALDSKFKKDKDIVLAAVKRKGIAFQFADASLKKNKEFVMIVVKQNGDALEFVDSSLKRDKDVVLAALSSKNGKAIDHVDDSLKKDKEILLGLLKDDYDLMIFNDAPQEYKIDPDFMKAAINNNSELLDNSYDDQSFIEPSLLKNKEFVLFVVEKKGSLLCQSDSKFKKDKEIAIVAASNDPSAMRCVDEQLQNDKDFILALIKQQKTPQPILLSEELAKDKDVKAALEEYKKRAVIK